MSPLKKFGKWYKTEWYRRRHRIVRGIIAFAITGVTWIWLLFLGMYIFAVLGSYLIWGLSAIASGGDILGTLSWVLLSTLWALWGIFDPRVTIEMLGEDWKWIRPMISLGMWILIAGLAVEKVVDRFRKRRAEVWELEDQLKGLDEQLSLGHISQEQYEQNKKKLLKKEVSALPSTSERGAGAGTPAPMRIKRKERELEDQLRRIDEELMYSVITEEEHERKKKKLLEGLAELKLQLGRGDISFEEYHRKKQELMEK